MNTYMHFYPKAHVIKCMWIEQEDMVIAQDEIFGPVMSLMKFKYV